MHRRLLIAAVLAAGMAFAPMAGAAQDTPPFERHYALGEQLYGMGKYADAYREFRRAAAGVESASPIEREKLAALTALSAAGAEDMYAEELLEAYLEDYPSSPAWNDVCFELAKLYFGRGDFGAASVRFEAVNRKDLGKRRVDEYNFKSGYSLFREGRYAEAVSRMGEVDFTSRYYPHAQYIMGYSEYRRGEYAAAKRHFTVIADEPAYRDVLPFYIIQIEFNEGNFHYVRENGGAVLRMATGDRLLELNRIVGESWFHTGGWSEAVQYLKRYEELGGPMQREVYYMIGFASYMVGDYDEAIGYLNRAAGPDDKLSQNASYHLADCYLRAGDRQRAMQSFAIASTQGYDDAISEDALFNYGKLQYELGGGYFNEAINVLNRYLTLYPSSSRTSQVKEYLAAAYYNSNNYDAAYQAIMQVPDPDNDMKAALQKITYFRGLEYYKAGDYENARRLLEQSLGNRFNAKYTALAGYWLAELDYRENDMESAAAGFRTYVRLSPRREAENMAARYNLGYVYFNEKNWDAAKEWFDEFLLDYRAKDSYAADALNRRGDIEYSNRAFWRAIEFYDKAAAMGTDERYYSAYQRAMMLGMVQRPERKIESLRDIVRKQEGPYVAAAMYELGRSYMGMQRYSDATKTLEKFIETYPSSPRYTAALNELGLAYQNLKNDSKALEYYKKVMEREKHSDASRSAMDGIRTIYVERNDVNAYFDYAEKMGIETDLGQMQRDSLAFVAAQRVYLSGDRDKAASALDGYIAGYPKGAYVGEALYFAGENALAEKNTEKAYGYYGRLVGMPVGDYTARGLERYAALGMELGRYGESAAAYERLGGMATTAAKRDDALGGYMKAVAAGGVDGDIISAADKVLAGATAENVRRSAQYAKATSLRNLGRNDEALPIYKLLSGDVSSAEGAESAYRVIKAVYDEGNNARVEQLVYDFADRNTPHSYWLGKAFIILGDVYLSQGDTFQARATYQSVVDGYPNQTDGIVEEARGRIAEL